MLTITAVIRSKPGHENEMKAALLAVADNVRDNEPGTISFFVSQDAGDNCVFTTHERFVDQAAMDRHNNSEASKGFFAVAKPILAGEVVLVTGRELSSKS